MEPVVGPHNTTVMNGVLPGASFYEAKSMYGQKPPYDLALPYQVYRRVHSSVAVAGPNWGSVVTSGFLAGGSQGNADTWAFSSTHTIPTGLMADALNRARQKCLDRLGSSAGWAENIAEYKQAASMMGARLWTLARAWKMLKSGNLIEALRVLNISPDSLVIGGIPSRKWTPRNVSRHYAALWMEIHFGWSPLLNDIYETLDILSSKPEPGHVSESACRFESFKYYAKGDKSTGLPYFYGDHETIAWGRISFRWEITNPNLYLASRLGVVNPATLAWNLLPLSWFVDWIVDVSAFLNNWSDLFGITLTDPCYTKGFKDVCRSRVESHYAGSLYGSGASVTQSLWCKRTIGFPDSQLRVKNPFNRISVSRGLTAISYLTQVGIGKGKS